MAFLFVMENQVEIWKDVLDYEGLYLVSSFGKVKSIKSKKEKILKGRDDSNGYLKVALYKTKICVQKKIHRLVALAFIDNPYNKKTVNHINGIKTDNRVENLEWCTHSENEKHSYYKLGKITNGIIRRKIPLQDIEKIKILYKNGLSMRKIAKQYNVSGSCICSLINNKTYVKWL